MNVHDRGTCHCRFKRCVGDLSGCNGDLRMALEDIVTTGDRAGKYCRIAQVKFLRIDSRI